MRFGDSIARWTGYALPPLVLVTWATVIFQAAASGRLSLMLAPLFRPLAQAGAVIMVALAVWYLVAMLPRPEVGTRRARRGEGSLLVQLRWIILLGPVMLAGIAAPERYSERIIQARGIRSSAIAGQKLDPQTLASLKSLLESTDPSVPVELSLFDLLGLAPYPEAASLLEGRTLRVAGQYVPEAGRDGAYKLTEMYIFCCAADALPLGFTVTGARPQDAKSMDWVQVTGKVRFVQTLGFQEVEMEAQSAEREVAPADNFGR